MPTEWNGEQAAASTEPLFFRNIHPGAVPDYTAAGERQSMEAEEASIAMQASLRAAQEQGRREAETAARVEVAQRVAIEREAIAHTIRQFQEEKDRYFSSVESEVVKLSLAIAERVLHREANMDPTLLAGAARVALEQVADGSDAVLKVSACEVHQWDATLSAGGTKATVEPDDSLPAGHATLKTRSGTVQLGMRVQLAEIERGFFELLNRRPAASA